MDTGDRRKALAAFTDAVAVYASLGAIADVTRVQTAFPAYGVRRHDG